MRESASGPSPADYRFEPRSWIVLGIALLILGLAFVQTLYRLTLPWDGWSVTRDATGSGQHLVFHDHLAADSSPIQRGDTLVAVQGQSYEDILLRALTLRPDRPPNWTAGGTVDYTVLRGAAQVSVAVPLVHLSVGQVLSRIRLTWVNDPTLIPELLITFFVFIRRPRQPAARLLFLLGAAYFASNGISQSVSGSNVVGLAEMFYREAFWPAQFFNSLIWPFVIAPVYVHLFLVFPVPKRPLARHPRLATTVLYGFMPALTVLVAVLSYGDPRAFWSLWSLSSLIDFVLAILLSIASAAHTLVTVQDPTRYAQIKWVAWGTIITSLGALSGEVLVLLGILGQNPLVDLLAFRIYFLAFPLGLAIAILRYQLFEIDILIRRTLIYGALTALLALVYFGLVIGLQQIFRGLTGQDSDLAIVLSTLIIAALSTPLRTRVQKIIDRRFYRRRYDATRVLANFSSAVRDQVDLDTLASELLRVTEDTIQPRHANLWLLEPVESRQNGDTT